MIPMVLAARDCSSPGTTTFTVRHCAREIQGIGVIGTMWIVALAPAYEMRSSVIGGIGAIRTEAWYSDWFPHSSPLLTVVDIGHREHR